MNINVSATLEVCFFMTYICLHVKFMLIRERGTHYSAQRDLVSFFSGEGHRICFIYTCVNYSDEMFLDGSLLANCLACVSGWSYSNDPPLSHMY